jgi:hypothetical protein
VAKASQSNGKQHTKKIEGECNLKSSGGKWILGVPGSPTGRQTCEMKLLTGGKSHSKMQKRCAIWGWEATDQGDVDKSGVGMEAGLKILKQPTDRTRQKSWHVKLWVDPGMAPKYFKIFTVTLKVPQDLSLNSNSTGSQIRNSCFQ